MCGLLIADDEEIVRSAVKRVITERVPALAPVFEASSGEEAVSLARQTRPCIVLMDVKMPGLGGLEATRAIRAESPCTRVVMLTAYDEFSFAQEALRLGAVDYLLKPVRPSLLLDVLQRVESQIQQEEKNRIQHEEASSLLKEALPLVEARLVRDLLEGPRDANAAADAHLSGVDRVLSRLGKTISWPAVMLVEVDRFDSVVQGMEPDRYERFCGLLDDIVRRAMPGPNNRLIGQTRPGMWAVIVSSDPKSADVEGIRALGHNIRYAMESSAPVTATIGIGHRYATLGRVPLSYAEAVRALLYKPHFGNNCVIHIVDLPDAEDVARPYPVELERRLIAEVRLGHAQDAEELLSKLADHLLAHTDQPAETIQIRLGELLALASRAAIEAGAASAETLDLSRQQALALRRLTMASEMRAWAFTSLAALLAQLNRGDRSAPLVSQALQYMRDNMQHPGLELEDVARAVHLSGSHLAHLLKAKMGTSFVKYLTQLRVEEAKNLLATTDMTVAAIALAVGYEDAAYFHRVFRRGTSLTPATYRQLLHTDGPITRRAAKDRLPMRPA
jgi:two-component system response regulator YesN